MDTATRRHLIVIALDDSEYAPIVVEHALDQAVRHAAVDLHFVTVVRRERDVDAAGQRLSRQVLEGVEYVRGATGDVRLRLHVRTGDTVDEIARLAGELDADLLVCGRFYAHGRRRSAATALVDVAPCPTLVVGLTEHTVETEQCADCAAVRVATDAEVWFCDVHRGDPRLHSSSLMTWSSGLSHDRLW